MKDCYGKVLPLTVDLARGLGVEQGEAFVCLKHQRTLAKEDDSCSSTLLKTHSNKLLAILFNSIVQKPHKQFKKHTSVQ